MASVCSQKVETVSIPYRKHGWPEAAERKSLGTCQRLSLGYKPPQYTRHGKLLVFVLLRWSLAM